MDRIWLPEDRERQAKVMRDLRLWDHDIHPRTPEGKASSAQNARKLGLRSAEWIKFTRLLKDQKKLLRDL